MDTNENREFEAALRLQQLATHTKLFDHARGITRVGRLPMFSALSGVGTVVALLLTQKQPLLVILGAVGLVALVSAAIKELNNRVDALVTLLERAKVMGPDLTRE
jgi:hypothetical protein